MVYSCEIHGLIGLASERLNIVGYLKRREILSKLPEFVLLTSYITCLLLRLEAAQILGNPACFKYLQNYELHTEQHLIETPPCSWRLWRPRAT